MPRRAAAAVAAMRAALSEMDAAEATAEELGAAGGRAAAEAYDRVADAERRAREQLVEGEGQSEASSSDPSSLAAVVVAPSETVLQQRPYFEAVIAAHAAGLLVAFAANSVTGLGQPALLYIVPATLGAVAATAVSRGEFGKVWKFTDVPSFGAAQALIDKERKEKEEKKAAKAASER
jgi:minor histocompatibility antigen H13